MKNKYTIYKNALTVMFTLSLWNTNIFAHDPASYFDQNTSVYIEIYPAEISIKKVKKLFFSLMIKEKAETEWRSLEEYFIDDIGFNILSLDNLQSSGFDTSSAIGVAVNYNLEKVNSEKSSKLVTLLLPTTDSTKAFHFLKETLINIRSQQEAKPKTPLLVEIENDTLIRIFDPAKDKMPIFIYRAKNFVIVSENQASLKNYSSPSSQPLNKNINFIESKKYYDKKIKNSEIIGFYFINQKVFDEKIRVKPRLLFDHILMDNAYVKELSANSDFISGVVALNDRELKVLADYTFPHNYLSKGNSFLANAFNFKNQSYFPDNISAPALAFFKWQTNLSSSKDNTEGSMNDQVINNFFTRLTGGVGAEVPQNMQAIFKDNISFYIQDVPILKDINHYYLWKGYLSVNYNPAHYHKFLQYMENLVANSKKSKNVQIAYSKTGDKSQWEISIIRFLKKYDKIKEQVILEENIVKMYIFADASQIIITHDPLLFKKKPAQAISTIYSRLLPENNNGKHMVFSYLDIHKFLAYLRKSSLAFSNNYLSYLENINSVFFLVNQDNDIITEELIIKLDK